MYDGQKWQFEEEELKEFELLVRELSSHISAAEYVNFDADIPAFQPMSMALIGNKKHEKIASVSS